MYANLVPSKICMIPQSGWWRRQAGVLLLLALVIVANFNIVFLGQTLVSSANYHPFDYRGLNPGAFNGRYPWVNWHDQGGSWWQWEPAGALFSQQYRSGRIPLWDPTVGGGVDLHVNLQPGQYYPPYVLLLLAGNTPALRDWYYLGQVFLSGLCCYLLLRRHGCHVLSAVCCGATFMLSGAMVQNINDFEGEVFALLPLVVLAADSVLRQKHWRSVGTAAIVLCLTVLTGFLPITVSGYILVAFYVAVDVCWRAWRGKQLEGRWRIDWIAAGRGCAAIALSLLLVSFLLIPVQMASHQDHSFREYYTGTGAQYFSFDRLFTLISPSITYDVWQLQDTRKQLFSSPDWAGSFFYIGLVPIVLALLGFPKRDEQLKKLWVFFVVSGGFILLKLLGIPPIQWIYRLPVFETLHFIPYFCGALTFCVAGLTGIGVERLVRDRSWFPAAAASLFLLAMLVLIVRFDETQPVNPLTGTDLWRQLAGHALEVLRVTILGAGVILLTVLRRRFRLRHFAALAALILISLDLLPLALRSRYLATDIWRHPPGYVRFLESDKEVFRVNGTHDLSLPANVSEAFALDVVSSRMTFNSDRYFDILRKYFAVEGHFPVVRNSIPSARPVLDLLNVKYVLQFSPDQAELNRMTEAGLTLRYTDGLFQVFENHSAWPRAFVARSVHEVKEPSDGLNALGTLAPSEAVVEGQPPATVMTGDPAAKVVWRSRS